MVAAEHDEIVHLRLTAVGPVEDVMSIDVFPGGASREAAPETPALQRAPDRRRDAASLAADIQGRTTLVRVPMDDAAIAGQPSGRFRGRVFTVGTSDR